MKHSKKRDLIISLFKDGTLLTANEVSGILPNIDRVTVYRNLAMLVQLGILREVNIRKGISSFELNTDNHQHLICDKCKKIVHVSLDTNKLRDILPKNILFNNIEINLKGICSDCK